MTEPQKDTQRALAAAKYIFDGRDPKRELSAVMVTLENLVALVLLAAMDNDTRKAAGMLNEGLLQGVEQRLALATSRRT